MKPKIITTNKPLPFGELSPFEFERLCYWLVEREGYEYPQHRFCFDRSTALVLHLKLRYLFYKLKVFWFFDAEGVIAFGALDFPRLSLRGVWV